MRHRSLMADGIRTVASNARQVSCAQDVIKGLWKDLMAEVDRHYGRGRRITPTTMRSLYESFDEIVMNNLQIVDCRLRETAASATKPKGSSIDVSYVGVMKRAPYEGYQDLYELFTLRVIMKSKVVKLHLQPHPITFEYHAAERLVERVDGQTLPFEMIAAELADWSLALWEIFRLMEDRIGHLPLSLPCMEGKGMLCGRFVELPVTPAYRTVNNRTGRFSSSAGWEGQLLPVFVIKTFVGQDKLRSEQVSALNRVARWRLLNKAEYMAARDASLWDVAPADEGYVVPEMNPKARADLVAILEDPAVKRAMTTYTLEANANAGLLMKSAGAQTDTSRPAWIPPKPSPSTVGMQAM